MPLRRGSEEEVKEWERKDPLTRFTAYLEKKNLLEDGLEARVDEEIAAAVRRFEAVGPADPLAMFDHAYAELPADVRAQRAEVEARMRAAAPPPDGEPAPPLPMRGQRNTSRWPN